MAIDKCKALISGFLISTVFTTILGLLMKGVDIPTTTVLPTSAPIWVGITTLIFLVLNE
ncbi:MAG: hypothetical protein JSW73_03635 [Candidatus Woesearchaeota archaeon]|nr:MAG: hypothetical protein JSW73_03635 [Candidatus Woesearchaeota archaeon]